MFLSLLFGNKFLQKYSLPLRNVINSWYKNNICPYSCSSIHSTASPNQQSKHCWKLYDFCITREYAVMANTENSGLLLNDVIAKLDNFAPKSLAESWDNVGLLVQPMTEKNVKRILLTNDLTEDVMEEAVKLCADLIISYHPPIFAPMKSVTRRTWKVIFECHLYILQCCHHISSFLSFLFPLLFANCLICFLLSSLSFLHLFLPPPTTSSMYSTVP